MVSKALDEFVDRRMSDAKAEMARIDPAFVKAAEAAVVLSDQGLVIPQVEPSRRLSKRWTKMLVECFHLVWTAQFLKGAVEGLDQSRLSSLDDEKKGRSAEYHLTSWVHHAYAVYNAAKVMGRLHVPALLRARGKQYQNEISRRALRKDRNNT